MSVLANTGESVESLLTSHWKTFGRNYFTRYDYEDCESEPCIQMMADLEKYLKHPLVKGQKFKFFTKTYVLKDYDNFKYCDPIDKSITTKQVFKILKKIPHILLHLCFFSMT